MRPLFAFLFLNFSLIFAATCPGGGTYDPTFDKCYIYYQRADTFLAAESTCRSIGANLAEATNGNLNSSAYWIGANLLAAPRWTWTTNNTLSYTNWAADQPADPSIFQCAGVREDIFLWQKELCYSVLPFVCTADSINPTPPLISSPTPPPNNTPCDPGYTQYGNQCFRIFSEFERAMDYHDANIFCRENQHATLPTIPSLAVQDFLFSFISNTNSNIWLGMICWGQHFDSCRWWYDTPDDGKSPPYLNFLAGSPASNGGPIQMLANVGQWNTQIAFWPSAIVVVCEKPARM